MFTDDLPMEQYYEWQKECIGEMMRVTKGIVFYNIQMLTGNKVALFMLFGYYADKIKEIIVWDKINAEPAMHDGILNSMYEFIIVFDKTDAIARQFKVFNSERGILSNVLRINKNNKRQDIKHNAMFPIRIPQHIIHYFTQPNSTILDPFMGSGTTAVAAIREKRHFLGFELNKEYYDKACERIRNEQAQLKLF
jgi:DNA modification methylase